MNRKWIYIIAFFILASVQLYVAARMIMSHEKILKKGREFKFEIKPIDPSDPFRGKYIQLEFKENDFKLPGHTWKGGQKVYVTLRENEEGIARVDKLLKNEPDKQTDYIVAEINKIRLFNRRILIDYPFNRYYTEEFTAGKIEKQFRESLRKEQKAYAIVYILNGKAVLKDVIINNRSLNSYKEE